jgi:hypothetical protein
MRPIKISSGTSWLDQRVRVRVGGERDWREIEREKERKRWME